MNEQLQKLINENRKLRDALTDIAMPVPRACGGANQLYRVQILAEKALKSSGEGLGNALLTAWFAYNRQNPEGFALQIQPDGSGRIIGPNPAQVRYFQSIDECINRHLLGDPLKSWEPASTFGWK